MNKNEISNIVDQVVHILEKNQREAVKQLADTINTFTSRVGRVEAVEVGSRPVEVPESGITPYYKKGILNGLPAGICIASGMKKDAWKVSFRQKYLGTYYSLYEATQVRRKAEMEFDGK